MKKTYVMIVSAIMMFIFAVAAFAAPPTGGDAGKAKYHPQRILVTPRNAAALNSLVGFHRANNAKVIRQYELFGNLQVVQIPKGQSIEHFVAKYKNSGLVACAEPDYIVYPTSMPNDPLFYDMWGLRNTGQSGGTANADIGALNAWNILHDAPNVVVAVIDTGVGYNHPDLVGRIWVNADEDINDTGVFENWPSTQYRINILGQNVTGDLDGIDNDGYGDIDDVHGINAITGSGDPMDEAGHGTHCAGIIGATGDNGIGVTGVAWNVKIMPLKFIGPNGGLTSDAIDCIYYAVEHGAHVMSNSWGGGDSSSTLVNAINIAAGYNIPFVVSAGNGGPDLIGDDIDTYPVYPASFTCPNIVTVAATDRYDQLAAFSNYGLDSVDLGAPGVDILSTYYKHYLGVPTYKYMGGTSMAAPHVAGALALLRQQHPSESYSQLISRLYSTVDQLSSLQGKCTSGGRLNLYRAVADASENPCDSFSVTPSSTADFSGVHGGPFSTCNQDYTLLNTSDHDIDWSVSSDVTWLSLPTGGTLTQGGDVQATVYVNANANGLAPGMHSGLVTFTNETDGCSIVRTVSLTVRPQLEITPAYGLSSGGIVGGPFTPSSQQYVLTNISGASLNWTASKNQTWVSLSATSGTLSPSASTTVTASINSGADSLALGSYTALVTFTNASNGSGNASRTVDLGVGPIFVKPTGSNTNSGLSWADAKQTVSSGVEAAYAAGRPEVWVASGTYQDSVSMRPGVALYGGFAGTETERSQRNWNANVTTLTASAGSTVVFSSGLTASARLDGFTVTGTGDTAPGMYCYMSSPTIVNNRIMGVGSMMSAGGIQCVDASPLIANNLIMGNQHCGYSGYAGGMSIQGVSSPLIINNTIVGNGAFSIGGIDCGAGSSPTIANNIIAYNTSGIRKGDGSNPTIANNNVFGNTGYNYNGLSPDAGSISQDPKFVTWSNDSDYSNDNFDLQSGSPCIETGQNSYVQTGWLDMDGQTRIQRTNVDMGAYEWAGTACIHVSSTGSDANNGFTWEYPKLTVQAGVDAALAGEQVWVKAATYVENITMKNGVALYGGFAGAETSLAQRDWGVNVTILDGDQSGSVISVSSASNTATRVDGFTIQNGSGTVLPGGDPNNLYGGGIYCYASAITVTNNIITSNEVVSAGGGIYCIYSPSPTISKNTISSNTADSGGAIGWDTCEPTVTANTISSNTADEYGGGLYIASAGGIVTNNVISGSSAPYGGAIFCSYASPAIINNTLSQNTGTTDGGGIACVINSQPTIANNVVAFGSSGIYAAGGMQPSYPTLRNNCVYGNTAYNYSGVNPGTGDISVNPRIVAGNWRLIAPSPCIDAGSSTDAPNVDRDGWPRPCDGDSDGSVAYDIGAFEYRPTLDDYPDGTEFVFGPLPVTACFPAPGSCSDYWVYVERTDKASGLRVYCSSTFSIGDLVNVRGAIQTDASTGERYIQAYTGWPQAAGGSQVLGSLGMRNQWLSGASGGYTPVIKDGFGFYNVGLLVQSWGTVTAVDGSGTFFYIDDGSHIRESSTSAVGVRVLLPSGVTAPSVGNFVKVTGISSSMNLGAGYVRALRPRMQSDISVINWWVLTTTSLTPGAVNYVTLPGIPQNPEPESVFVACSGCPQIDLDGYLTRYDAPTQQWDTHWYGPTGSFGESLLGDGFGLDIPGNGSDCFYYMRTDATGDQMISLPRGSTGGTTFSLIGSPFGSSVAFSSCKVTDGYSILSLTEAISRGWLVRIEYWTGSAWQQYSGTSWQPSAAYKVFPRNNSLALIIPAP